ncbi:hypothetical protein B5S28_g1723 [[Candida] boidinii]|nr:hypothetical protein B5S28_g1723 [[Candida] boidinii]OWB59339.1 hypothetical protein B5S29_g195 [[Candida] boidinii]
MTKLTRILNFLALSGLLNLANCESTKLFDYDSIATVNITQGLTILKSNESSDFSDWIYKPVVAGSNGSGITIGIIGDGVNYKSVGTKCIGSNCTVLSAYDILTSEQYEYQQDEVSFDTLCADIILQQASEVSIKSYKVFDNAQAHTSDILNFVKGIEKAVEDEVDLILVTSNQQNGGWSSSYISNTLNDIIESKNIPIVMPIGQTGGLFQISDGAAAKNVITVGAANSDGALGWSITIGDYETFYYNLEPLDLYFHSNLSYSELSNCSKFSVDSGSDSEILIFANTDNCSISEIKSAIKTTNFTNYFVVGSEDNSDNVEYFMTGAYDSSEVAGGAYLEYQVGNKIINQLKNNDTEKILVTEGEDSYPFLASTKFTGNVQNYNSSFGPTLDLNLKPNIIAPGTFYFKDYELLVSGSALSASIVSAAIANYVSSLDSDDDDEWKDTILDRVTSSGTLIEFNNIIKSYQNSISNPVIQGGGIIDIDLLVNKNYEIIQSYGILNDSKNFNENFQFTIVNNNNENSSDFEISYIDSVTLYSQSEDMSFNDYQMYRFPTEFNATNVASVEISVDSDNNKSKLKRRMDMDMDMDMGDDGDSTDGSSEDSDEEEEQTFSQQENKSTKITLKAGESINVTISVTAPDFSSEESRIPIYGGYIQVTEAATNYTSNIPFFGVESNMNELPVQTYYPFYWKKMWYPTHDPSYRYCEMWEDGSQLNQTDDWLQVYYDNRMGSQMVDVFVVEKDWNETDFKYPAVPGENKYINRINGARGGNYPLLNSGRTNVTNDNQWDDWKDRKLANGDILEDGEYRIVLRILNHFVDDISDWDSWYYHVSPWFQVNMKETTTVLTTDSMGNVVTSSASSTVNSSEATSTGVITSSGNSTTANVSSTVKNAANVVDSRVSKFSILLATFISLLI